MFLSKKLFLLLWLILQLILFHSAALAEKKNNHADISQLETKFHQLLQETKDNVQTAIEIYNRSGEALSFGKQDEAISLIKEAISVLEGDGKEEKRQKAKAIRIRTKKKISAEPEFIYGINTGFLFNLDIAEEVFRNAADLGVTHIKVIVMWDAIESKNGHWIWKGSFGNRLSFDYDYYAELAQKYELSVIPFFVTRAPGKRTSVNPLDADEYAEMVYTFVKRYKDTMNIQYTEFHNEVNTGYDGSRSKSWGATPQQLVAVDNAAYDRLKKTFPDIMVGSSSFTQPRRTRRFSIREAEKNMKEFMTAYFNSRPQFDFFAVHDYSPQSPTEVSDIKYASQFHFLDDFRSLLDKYGYHDKPIFVTEGGYLIGKEYNTEEEAAFLLVQSYVVTRGNVAKNKIIGKIHSKMKTTIPIKEGRGDWGLINYWGKKRKGYFFYKTMMGILLEYPYYVKRISGKINAYDVWIEQFADKKGKKLYVAFAPFIENKKVREPQKASIYIGSGKTAMLTRFCGKTTTLDAENDGCLKFEVYKEPVFVEVK